MTDKETTMFPEQIDPSVTYDEILNSTKLMLKDLKLMREAYLDSGEVNEEDVDEVFPDLAEDIEYYKTLIKNLKDEKTRTWFVDSMREQIKEQITSEDMETILAGLVAMSKVEEILGGGIQGLMEFVSPQGASSKQLN